MASRIVYNSYCRDFNSRAMLSKSNQLLENEIEENRKITAKLEQTNLQLKELTMLDDLTGIPNRRSFRDFIDRSFVTYVTEASTLSVIMIDIDFFKQYNDYYGHEEGDKALIAIAEQLNSVVAEPNEFAVRWGGEEFIYAAFNVTQEFLRVRADTILEKVAALDIKHEVSPLGARLTISLGASTVEVAVKKDIIRSIRLADEALYQAKDSGRNCVVILNGESGSQSGELCGGVPVGSAVQ